MRIACVCVCARRRCDDDFTQNEEKSRRGVKGMFCKSSARVAFVLLWRENVVMRFFQSKERKKEIFRKRAKKEILSKSFLFAEVILRWFLPPSVCDLILGQKVAASLKFYDDESVGTIWLVS